MREFQAEGRHIDDDLKALEQAFDRFVRRWLARATNPPPGLVPETIFWMVDEAGEFVGRISIRHYLTDRLRIFGGHIGYEVRPSRRREGHGKMALRLALTEAQKLGLGRVMLTCDATNTGSRKIIEANGGVLEDIIEVDFQEAPVMRWWIEVGQQ